MGEVVTRDQLIERIRADRAAGRSIAFTLASAQLIDKSEANSITTEFGMQGDFSCRPSP